MYFSFTRVLLCSVEGCDVYRTDTLRRVSGGQRELRGSDVVSIFLKFLDHPASTGAIGLGPMDQNNIQFLFPDVPPFHYHFKMGNGLSGCLETHLPSS